MKLHEETSERQPNWACLQELLRQTWCCQPPQRPRWSLVNVIDLYAPTWSLMLMSRLTLMLQEAMGVMMFMGSIGKILATGNSVIEWRPDVLVAESSILMFCLSLTQSIRCNWVAINTYHLDIIGTMWEGGRSTGLLDHVWWLLSCILSLLMPFSSVALESPTLCLWAY